MFILTAKIVKQRTLNFWERKRLNLWHSANSIRDHIVLTLAIPKLAIKLLKYFGLSSLSTLQVFLTRKPFNALLIKKNIKRSTIQIMPPLLESMNYGIQLALISRVIALRIVQFLAFKSNYTLILE